ncbi:MAG: hypothetical protein ACLFQQ_22980 [Desulfococcaceae bacterium]
MWYAGKWWPGSTTRPTSWRARRPGPASLLFWIWSFNRSKGRHHESFDFRRTIDGARVVFEGGWGLVRASNTSPVIVLRFEAESESRLREIGDLVEEAQIDEAKSGLQQRRWDK